MLGHVSHNLGLLARSRGDVDEARRLYREGLAHYRAAGDVHDEAVTLGNLGAIAHLQDRDYAEARHLYNESLGLRRTLGDRYGIAVMLNNLGEIAELEGEIETAVVLFLHAERLLRELQSAHVSAPTENLKRLAERLGIERWAAMRVVAEQARWEEVVESDRLSPSL